MSARFSDVSVVIEPDGVTAHVRFRVENRSSRAWTADGGKCLGWQVFDPESDLFIREGEWQPLGGLAPGDSIDQELVVALPPEQGRYHVYISVLDPSVGWYYRRGWPFVLVEAVVDDGRATLVSARPFTIGRLRRASRLRAVGKALSYPPRTVFRNWGLIRSMVGRDIAARYRGSLGGALWTVLNPLLLIVTYFFVFGIVLRARFPGDPSRTGFALYFLAGMLPWLPFAEAVGRAPSVVLEHRGFVKRLVFPVEILPVNLTLAALVTQAFALAIFLVFLVVTRGELPVTALWVPVLIVPQALLTVGLAWFLAALGVFLRDLGQLLGYILTVWFFATPICYPEDGIPASLRPVLELNPMLVLVRAFRDVLLPPDTHAPAFGPLWKLWLLSMVVCVAGHAFFYKLRRSFPDML